MSKKTLLLAICEKTQVSLAQAEAALDAVTQHIGERLVQGQGFCQNSPPNHKI